MDHAESSEDSDDETAAAVAAAMAVGKNKFGKGTTSSAKTETSI